MELPTILCASAASCWLKGIAGTSGLHEALATRTGLGVTAGAGVTGVT